MTPGKDAAEERRRQLAAREDERREIARELHDALGQHLVGLKLELAACLAALPGPLPDGLRARFASLGGSVDGVIDETRRIVTKLRPLILDDLGLPAALQWLCEDFERRSSIRCPFACGPELAVEPERATALFRIVQEALTNVARHARASSASVSLQTDAGVLVLRVRDNGRGMDEPEKGFLCGRGLTFVRERASLLGGDVVLTSLPGKGTILTVRLPR
ncbi:MAG: sensor histidine kinase [Elusimicrobia bacterium]|nr:sensor histidine kinase [Elusimicrobiota bacterium]